MNRRDFAKKTLGALGLSILPLSQVISAEPGTLSESCHLGGSLLSSCGMQLKLIDQQWATQNQDDKQFILTFSAPHQNTESAARIYDVKDQHGRSHQVFMTPVADNRLQAVFNWRTSA
ncbi:DUF6916 family protein [Marinicella sp. W31]|uniref:DUF6916 family protein n=1 Tax=Marinicella sp. W31 TaxID=3023713 RepID=UPI003756B505